MVLGHDTTASFNGNAQLRGLESLPAALNETSVSVGIEPVITQSTAALSRQSKFI